MTTLEAFARGWGIALKHPILIMLKWVLNLSAAILLVGPLHWLLAQDLDNTVLGSSPDSAFSTAYVLDFLNHYAGEIRTLSAFWWPILMLFAAGTIFLNGGILSAIQRRDRMSWSETITACGRSFPSLLLILTLTLFLGLLALYLPLALLEGTVSYLETIRPESHTLQMTYWILLAGFFIVLTLFGLATGRAKAWVGSRIGQTTFLLALIILAGVLPFFVLPGTFDRLADRFPDARLIFWLYWGGVACIAIFLGTWVWRIYHIARLLVCRPREGDGRPTLMDATHQFFRATTKATRYYVPTLVLWFLFFGAALAIIPLMHWLQQVLLPAGASPVEKLGFGQVAIVLRILAGIAMLAGFHVWFFYQERPERPDELYAADPESHWRPTELEPDQESTSEKVEKSPEPSPAASPLYPEPTDEKKADG